MVAQVDSSTTYLDQAYQYGQFLKYAAGITYEKIQQPGEVQNRVFALARTSAAIASVYYHWDWALGAAALTVALPEVARPILDGSEAMVTGLWNKLSPNLKTAALAAGTVVSYYGVSYLTIPACMFSAKVGGERAIENLNKQAMALASAQAEANAKKY